MRRRLRGDRDDDGFDLARLHVEHDAGLRIRAEECAGVRHQRLAGAVLFADVRVAVEDVVEEVRVFELPELVAFVAVDPGQALAGEFDGSERIVVGAAHVLDGGGELGPVLIPVAEDEVRRNRFEEADGFDGLNGREKFNT